MKNLVKCLLEENLDDISKYKSIQLIKKNQVIKINVNDFMKRFCCQCHKLVNLEELCMKFIHKHYNITKERCTRRTTLRKELENYLKIMHFRLHDNTWKKLIKNLDSEHTQYRKLKIKKKLLSSIF